MVGHKKHEKLASQKKQLVPLKSALPKRGVTIRAPALQSVLSNDMDSGTHGKVGARMTEAEVDLARSIQVYIVKRMARLNEKFVIGYKSLAASALQRRPVERMTRL
ncbi:MAG: hypothetical protein KDA51_09170 [Planctomycetales bacterium]|nr:hypothetical protein [Planctomycetales bacterium]